MSDTMFQDIDTFDNLSSEIQREINCAQKNLMGTWWGRLPLVVVRPVVFANLLGRTLNSMALVESLGSHIVDEKVMEKAKEALQDKYRRQFDASDNPVSIDSVKILDPFSGSGSIPLGAGQLGIDAHAVEINPVAYILQLCRLVYPQKYGVPESQYRGVGGDGTWAGIADEILYWGYWLDSQLNNELSGLYPSLTLKDNHVVQPVKYIWARTLLCDRCGVIFPLLRTLEVVKNREVHLILDFVVKDGVVTCGLREGSPSVDIHSGTVARNRATCPVCGQSQPVIATSLKEPMLVFIVSNDDEGKQRYHNSQEFGLTQVVPPDIQEHIQALQDETGLPLPDDFLPSSSPIFKYGIRHYAQLFTDRQLLILLTYVKYIAVAHGQMLSRRYEIERANAVATYLGLILVNSVNFNNVLCQWSSRNKQVQSIFSRSQYVMTWSFVEVNPFLFRSFHSLAKRIHHNIVMIDKTVLPANVKCASATNLPYPDEYFDGIVTAPPYYDTIRYEELSDLHYLWLKRAIGHLHPHEFRTPLSPKEDEIVLKSGPGSENDGALNMYYEKLRRAYAECKRVLKTGHLLSVLVSSKESERIENFLKITQSAGFELINATRIRLASNVFRGATQYFQIILTFRKNKLVQQTSEALVNAEIVLELAKDGVPTLYEGLANLLLEYLEYEDLDHLIPPSYQGSQQDRLQEYLATCKDPRDVLNELGRPTLRRIAKERNLAIDGVELKDAILKSFGFKVPETQTQGVITVLQASNEGISRVRLAQEIQDLHGIYLTVTTDLESLLKKATWSWANILFGSHLEVNLAELAGKSLEYLSMGDHIRMFREFPRYVVKQELADKSLQLFGRPHPYSVKGKIISKLEQIVALRNRVVHNKDDYLTKTPFEQIQRDIEQALKLIIDVLMELKQGGAIPIIVRPVRKIVDAFGRCKVELKAEDGCVMEIYITQSTVELGCDFYFFPVASNPRPIDPPLLSVSDLERACKVES